jgi:hypothetical protein
LTSQTPIKRVRSVQTISYTWWEEICGVPKELTIFSLYTGGVYDTVFTILLKVSQEINMVTFSEFFLLKDFCCAEFSEAKKKVDELVKKIEQEILLPKKEERVWKETVCPTNAISFSENWQFLFKTSLPKPAPIK